MTNDELKFIFVQPVGANAQYVTVLTDEVGVILNDFANKEVLTITDQLSGQASHFNVHQVAFLTVQDYNPNRSKR